MASLGTQKIAAPVLSHGSKAERLPAVAQRTSFDSVTIAFHWATVLLGAWLVHDRNLVPAVT